MEIGIIGTGDMGKLYAKELAQKGFVVNCSDLPEKTKELEAALAGIGVRVLEDGHAVSRISDIIFYLVPVETIEETVARYGPSTKQNAIVSSGTSVMTPAIVAFEKYLHSDVNIINWHWLFGPSVKPQGQSSAVVNHRSDSESYRKAMEVFNSIGMNVIELPSFKEHDKITADTQAVTHLGFLAMGTAWRGMGEFPWENPTYTGGIDNVKVAMCLRIYSGKSHVYAGLAIQNPFAREQIIQYAVSLSDLFGLMIQEKETEFKDRIFAARDALLEGRNSPVLLDDKIMKGYALSEAAMPRKPNSHLSLLAMADAWHQSGINPYDNMLCQTPVFKLRVGIAEYLLANQDLLEESLHTAVHDKGIRRDDLEFHKAVMQWANVVRNGDPKAYQRLFDETKGYFKPDDLARGMKMSSELIKTL